MIVYDKEMTFLEMYELFLDSEYVDFGFFISSVMFVQNYHFLNDFTKDIQKQYVLTFRNYSFSQLVTDENENLYLKFRECFENFLRKNEYKYNGLYETMFLDYNPLENYNMSELATNNNHIDNNIGSQTNINDILNGVRSNTTTDTQQVKPFDTDVSFKDNQKNVVTSQQNSITDKTTENIGQRKDTQDTSGSTTLNRSGNIGVTTSQQMLESERKILNFNFYDILVSDFINEYCWLCD